MELFDRVLELFITVVLIIGGYQFYFWCQRQSFYPARRIETHWDGRVAFDPRWVWVYSGLYYPMILLVALAQPDWRTYAITVGGFLFLLACQMFFFLRFPVEIPDHWREIMRVNVDAGDRYAPELMTVDRVRELYPRSMRFLDTVWHFDKMRNSMPSMHVSVATMVDLSIAHHWVWFHWVGWLFPVLIGTSAIKTKQHYVLDVVPGALMGVSAYLVWNWAVS